MFRLPRSVSSLAAVVAVGLMMVGTAVSGEPVPVSPPPAPVHAPCEESCLACNMSTADLRTTYSVTTPPSKFLYARPFLDGAGMVAFNECFRAWMQDHPGVLVEGCSERAVAACVSACKEAK